ncbi:MAG: hypothetical protein K8T26_14870 [Lentisphaerae bacterium]|nr:hypothetical protein [Lentisphaerota bacterium]
MTADPGRKPLPKPPSYRRQWILTGLILTGLVAWIVTHRGHAPEQEPTLPPEASHRYVDWFVLLGLPELPGDLSLAPEYPDRLVGWLTALRREGFFIMPLNLAVDRLEQGKRLPERTVVLLFEPGYRVTYEAIGDMLEALDIPAAWITQDPGRHVTDRRFLSAGTRARMQRTGLWEIGLRDPDREAFVLYSVRPPPLHSRLHTWAPETGRSGINRAGATTLKRLNANRAWSTDEFVDRLDAELPIQSSCALTARVIQNRLWGTLPRLQDSRPLDFDLAADVDQYVAGVAWLGTAGLPDSEVTLTVRERFGQLWLRFRSDIPHGHRVSVGFADDQVRVDVQEGDQNVRRAVAPFALASGAALHATVRLQGRQLQVRSGDQVLLALDDIDVTTTPAAVFEMSVTDILPGAALAHGVELQFTPISGTAVEPVAGVTP